MTKKMPEAYLTPTGPPSSAWPKALKVLRAISKMMPTIAVKTYNITLKPKSPDFTSKIEP